ncbi:MAG: DUF5683 domain-containing protein [Bacteroidales bacterium]|nr:DUF5683 domain-containing protein [Bacteroidales bacterium]
MNSGSGLNAPSTQSADTTGQSVPAAPPFKIKTYFSSLVMVRDSLGTGKVPKDTLTIGRMFSASVVLPGYSQLYNRQYWKVPIVLGTIGTGLYFGYQNNIKYLNTDEDRFARNRNLFYAGAALAWWGTLMDGAINYKSVAPVLPGRAALYSALLPGLGQAYNGDYWRIPIYCGGLMTFGYFIHFNHTHYQRYRNDYNNSRKTPSEYAGHHSSENLKWYRDTYRRYRDYCILGGILLYAINIIDANVFAYLQDFDVSDDLSLHIRPGFIESLPTRYASAAPPVSIGLSMSLHF